MNYDTIFAQHKNVALQFSGGKDSLATLYWMKPYWDRLTVYWLNSGDPFPDTVEQMKRIRAEVPTFIEVQGKVVDTHIRYGLPSDIIPGDYTALARLSTGTKGPVIVDRYTCCAHSLWMPMRDKMKEDQITLVIRGQRNEEEHKGPVRSGEVLDGFTFLYPIETWTEAEVFSYLKENDIPLPAGYSQGMNTSPDCLHCTAWTEYGIQQYVKKAHPQAYRLVQERLNMIKVAVEPYYQRLQVIRE